MGLSLTKPKSFLFLGEKKTDNTKVVSHQHQCWSEDCQSKRQMILPFIVRDKKNRYELKNGQKFPKLRGNSYFIHL